MIRAVPLALSPVTQKPMHLQGKQLDQRHIYISLIIGEKHVALCWQFKQ